MRVARLLPVLLVALYLQPARSAAQAPPEETAPPPAAPVLETAARMGERFRDAVLGRSLTLSVARTVPEVAIHPGTDVAVDLERYEGRDGIAPAIAFAGTSADLLPIELGGGYFITPFALNFAASYTRFTARQTLQTTGPGLPSEGRVRGDYVFAAGQISQWLLWEGEWLPGGLHAWNGLGAGLLRFEGDLAYNVGGTDYVAHLENDGLPVQITQTFGLELRLADFVLSAYGLRILRSGTSGADASLSLGGRTLAQYTYTFESRAYLLGYVINL